MTTDSADSGNEQFRRYAQTIRDLRISHEAGHAVLAEHFGYELRHLSIDASIVSDGATGGSAEIHFPMYPTRSDFSEQLQNIATVLMGGRAAEELTHSKLAQATHGKQDVSDFKERVKEWRTEMEMDAILDEGYRRSKALLSNAELSEQHRRLCHFLATEPHPEEPNGRFLRRVMKGLS